MLCTGTKGSPGIGPLQGMLGSFSRVVSRRAGSPELWKHRGTESFLASWLVGGSIGSLVVWQPRSETMGLRDTVESRIFTSDSSFPLALDACVTGKKDTGLVFNPVLPSANAALKGPRFSSL